MLHLRPFILFTLEPLLPRQFLIDTQLRGIDRVYCMYKGVLMTIKTIKKQFLYQTFIHMCTSICASEIETQIYHRTRNMFLQNKCLHSKPGICYGIVGANLSHQCTHRSRDPMDKAPDYESGDCKFESCRDHKFYTNFFFINTYTT